MCLLVCPPMAMVAMNKDVIFALKLLMNLRVTKAFFNQVYHTDIIIMQNNIIGRLGCN